MNLFFARSLFPDTMRGDVFSRISRCGALHPFVRTESWFSLSLHLVDRSMSP